MTIYAESAGKKTGSAAVCLHQSACKNPSATVCLLFTAAGISFWRKSAEKERIVKHTLAPARGRKRTLALIPLLVLAAVVAFGISACGGRPGSRGDDGRTAATGDEAMWAREGRRERAVEAIEITTGSVFTRVSASGRISGAREATVVSESQGVLQRVEFDLGDRVERGDLLAAFDNRVERLAMEQARAQVQSADMELAAVRRGHESGASSRTELARAEAAAAGAASAYQLALKRYQDRTITAPISGRVASRDARISAGNFLSSGATVARIVDTDRLQVELAVGEREVAYIAPGLPAELILSACGGQPQPGVVRSVAAGSDPATGSFAVIVAWDNRCGDEVRSGMTVQVHISPRTDREAVLVPTAALTQRDGRTVVYVVDGGAAEMREVTVGRRVGNRAEALSGLQPGELVAVSALSALGEGDPVAVTVTGFSGELE